jgi:hypothetical protein
MAVNITTKTFEKLLPDYSEILKIYKKTSPTYLFRNSNKEGGFVSKVPRKNRKPKDTSEITHKVLDKLFYEKFGWRARSEGLFCIGGRSGTYYGNNRYIIFPKNGFKYVYSDNIDDLYAYMGDEIEYASFDRDNISKPEDTETMRKIINKKYTDKNLLDFLIKGTNSYQEIMIKCDKYYMLNITDDKNIDLFNTFIKEVKL